MPNNRDNLIMKKEYAKFILAVMREQMSHMWLQTTKILAKLWQPIWKQTMMFRDEHLICWKNQECSWTQLRRWRELDKDADRSNLSSKVKCQSLALLLNVLFLSLVFIGFNTCKVRFGISYIITIIIVQAILNVGLLLAWSCMCFVEDMMNTLNGCDLLEKVVNMTNVHEHNDVTLSIKVQQFRSCYAMYVYYNCTRMYIIIVLVFCVNAMAIDVIVNQAEYQWRC